MSLLDEFREIEQRITKRLSELEPAAIEYNELKQVAERLGITPAKTRPSVERSPRNRAAAASARPPRRAAPVPRTGGRRPTRRATRPGSRQDDVMRLVSQRPGITVGEIGKQLGVDATGLYRVVKRLQGDGRIRKEGTALRPA